VRAGSREDSAFLEDEPDAATAHDRHRRRTAVTSVPSTRESFRRVPGSRPQPISVRSVNSSFPSSSPTLRPRFHNSDPGRMFSDTYASHGVARAGEPGERIDAHVSDFPQRIAERSPPPSSGDFSGYGPTAVRACFDRGHDVPRPSTRQLQVLMTATFTREAVMVIASPGIRLHQAT